MAKPKFDVYEHVTREIVTQIENGTPSWRKPWTGAAVGGAMPLRWNGEPYRGINILMLWAVSFENDYCPNRWLTYRQAQELGGQVRKGEKSATVIKYGTFDGDADRNARQPSPEDTQKLSYCRAYRVFNADQIEGLPDTYYIRPDPPRDLGTKPDPALDKFFARTGAKIETTPDPRAYYDIANDQIHMPPIETFFGASKYYGCQCHELVHWTGATKRLDRLTRFGDRRTYAFEELVAEIGACMLSAHIGTQPDFEQSAAYVEGWLAALKEDNRAIFPAASEAQKAIDYIMNLTNEKTAHAA